MPAIDYEGQRYTLLDNESVLDALLRNGLTIAHSCKAGSCGSCLMRSSGGVVPSASQASLKDSWKAQGYFLACVCRPDNDLQLTKVGTDGQLGATITELDLLSNDVLRVRLRCDEPFAFRAGQYVALLRDDGIARSYSIASLPDESYIELHVRKVAGGNMSGWLHDVARIGDRVFVRGPLGDCFYVPGNEDQPMLLVGTGTGLAPLYGILRDALRHGHRGPIHLFHGALHRGGLYLMDELRRLVHAHSHVAYTPAVLEEHGPLDQVVLTHFPKLKGWRGFVCGDPKIVQVLKKKLFLSGMASRDIYADAFLPTAT